MIEKNNKDLSVVRQSEMLSIHRSGLYYKPCEESSFNIDLMKVIDEQFLEKPFYGVARMTEHLNRMGYLVNVKRIRRLYRLMDLRAIFPAPKTTQPNKKHKKYPVFVKGFDYQSSKSGLGLRYNLHSNEARLYVSGSHDRSLQSLCGELGYI